MKLIAIIPARGGSKGIPRKNLKCLCGKPLIQYTIESALKSKYISEIFLSTEDDEIAAFGNLLGLSVQYRRPIELADDKSPTIKTVLDALRWVQAETGVLPENTLVLQPTSPLRTFEDIDGSVEKFYNGNAPALVSVHEMHEHPYECVYGNGSTAKYLFSPPDGVSRRQDYREMFFYINGAIYLAKTDFLMRNNSFLEMGNTQFFEMPRRRGIDIDTYEDLAIAEAFIKLEKIENR